MTMAQRDVMNFSGRFASAMADAYDQLAASAKTQKARDTALDRKRGNVTAALVNATDENPLVGLMDMLVMVTIVRQSSEDPWFTELFGDDGAKLIAVLKDEETDIWQIGSRYLTPAQLTEIHDVINHWRRDHPNQRYVAMVRLTDFPEAKPGSGPGFNRPGSVFGLLFLDPLAGLDPAVRQVELTREAAERMFFYIQWMPILVSWEAESAYRRMTQEPQMQKFLDDTSRFTDNTSKFTDNTLKFANATKEVAEAVKGFPPYLTEERQKAVDQVAQKFAEQRDGTVKQVAQAVQTERDAAIRQVAETVAVEREQIIHAATTRVASERQSTIDQLNATIQTQRQALVQDMESATARSINRIFLLATVLVVVSVVVTVLAVLILRARRPMART
jgi:hypothetical protein